MRSRMRGHTTDDVVRLLRDAEGGQIRAVGRLLSLLEEPDMVPVLRRAWAERGLERPAGAHVIGITGAAGVGKSSTVAALVPELRRTGGRVAVLAVDPSSPLSGGALLGDRVRMRQHGTDSGTYIRSLASRGQVGGLSRAVPFAARLLAGVGFGTVLVETVGTGQSEVDVLHAVDTVVVVCAPGLGDEVQAAKAGLLEIADLYVVNKADLPDAQAAVRDLRRTAALARTDTGAGAWRRPVITARARDGDVAGLVKALEDRRGWLAQEGRGSRRRAEQEGVAVRAGVRHAIDDLLRAGLTQAVWDDVTARVLTGRIDEAEAAREVLAAVSPGLDDRPPCRRRDTAARSG